MKITNHHGLPDIFCEAVNLFDSDYDRGDSDHTATELIRPVRISVLTKRHWEELSEDVSDRVWALAGQVKHLIFQRLAEKYPERYIAERRMYATVACTKVSGRLDLYDRQTSILWDYKESSVWKFVIGDTAEWEAQANINRYCLTKFNLTTVSALKNLVILKDWKAREAERRGNSGGIAGEYPQCAVHIVELPMWTDEKCEQYIAKRIYEILAGQDDPPLCTPEERWERGEKWAVMKKGRKSAVKLWDDEPHAIGHAGTLPAGHYVEHRPAEPTRCLRYCPVAEFCDFGRQALGLPALAVA